MEREVGVVDLLMTAVLHSLAESGFTDAIKVAGISLQMDIVPAFSEVVVMDTEQNVYRGMWDGNAKCLSHFRKLERPQGGR